MDFYDAISNCKRCILKFGKHFSKNINKETDKIRERCI